MKEKNKVYESPASLPNDEFWLTLGRELVKGSIPSLLDASKNMLTGLNILQGIYAGIIGFTAYIPEDLDVLLKSLFFLPFIFWVIALFFYLDVSFTKKYTIELLSPEVIKHYHETMCHNKQRSLTIGYWFQAIGILAFFTLLIIRNLL
ncbi:MAG: hypothetical protein JXJ04_01870 [Spirochaetales bacterium]|nr:hypothetical protein [Spirochaetales bacterium]